MKRYTDYTSEELCALDDAQIQRLIDLEIAYDGILPVDEPKAEALPELPERDVEAFAVHGNHFMSESDAQAVAAIDHYDLDWNMSYDHKFLKKKDAGIVKVKAYSEEVCAGLKDILADHSRIKKKNEAAQKEYSAYVKATNAARDRVWSAVRDAAEGKREYDRAAMQYERYLDLAEGDKEIASKFLRGAYSPVDPELARRVLSDMGGWLPPEDE